MKQAAGQPRVHAGRDRQGRRGRSAAILRRRCWKCWTQRRTTRSAITTSNSPLDLSRVFFVATANHLGPVQPALRDRMEVIPLAGYTLEEKVDIARSFLVPRQMDECGLATEQSHRWSAGALRDMVGGLHARGRRPEPRSPDRLGLPQGGAPRIATATVEGASERQPAGAPHVVQPPDGDSRRSSGRPASSRTRAFRTSRPGVATGVAWTETGGDVLYIEASLLAGRQGATSSSPGQLGNVMQESARAAVSHIRAQRRRTAGARRLPGRATTCTCTCPPARSPRTARRRASRWPRPSSRPCAARRWDDDVAMTGEITLVRARAARRRHPREGAGRAAAGAPHVPAAGAERGRPRGSYRRN